MSAPIHAQWWNRPGWGEFRAMRNGQPTHGGFDSYTEPLATIYGTANNGRVINKGYVGGMQWGYYVDVFYPATAFRLAYYQRDCHLNEMAWIPIGSPVGPGTSLARVGRSGNARDIYWPVSQSPNGRELWHAHSETYLSNRLDFARRTNPHSVWGSSLAGGGFVRIDDDDDVTEFEFDFALQRRQREETMYVQHENPKYPQVYATFTDANGSLRLRYCKANEAAIAVAGGLIIAVNDGTLTNLGIEAGFTAQGMIPLPKVDVTIPPVSISEAAIESISDKTAEKIKVAPTAAENAAETVRQLKLPGN